MTCHAPAKMQVIHTTGSNTLPPLFCQNLLLVLQTHTSYQFPSPVVCLSSCACGEYGSYGGGCIAPCLLPPGYPSISRLGTVGSPASAPESAASNIKPLSVSAQTEFCSKQSWPGPCIDPIHPKLSYFRPNPIQGLDSRLNQI